MDTLLGFFLLVHSAVFGQFTGLSDSLCSLGDCHSHLQHIFIELFVVSKYDTSNDLSLRSTVMKEPCSNCFDTFSSLKIPWEASARSAGRLFCAG